MKPKVVVVCQEGGHEVALEYSRIVAHEGYDVMVNFPSLDEFEQAEVPSQLINERTSAVILIISKDLFPASGVVSGFKIDTEVIHDLLVMTKGEARPRLIPILLDKNVEPLLKNHWLGQLQYKVDDSIEREKTLHRINLLAGRSSFNTDISSFEDVETILTAIEPGYTIEKIADERVSDARISYEIFKCSHKVRKEAAYYVHLHKRITISATTEHIRENYPNVYSDSKKTAILAIEDGQTQIEDRLKNVVRSLNCHDAIYLEQIVASILEEEFSGLQETIQGSVSRDFLEPQVRRGFGVEHPSSTYEFSDLINWISGQRPGILVLLGQGGVGKTWTLLNLKQRIGQGQIKFTKDVKRSLVFITSTDVNKSIASAHLNKRSITLYDLYIAYFVAVYGEEAKQNALSRNTFYDAIQLGNLIVFIDGLDEIISRNRSRFDPSIFFNDLSDRLVGDTIGKVIISCRNIFFDFEQTRIDFPYIETWELLPFDKKKRDEYFVEGLSDLPKKLEFAINLSDAIAALPSGRYIPFVLSLIKKIALEEANDPNTQSPSVFQSNILNTELHFDRIVGQFCNREIDKAADPTIELSVDQQITTFCRIARLQESGRGMMNMQGIETALSEILKKRDVKAVATHLITHPFVSQEQYQKNGIICFSFDFMPEFFLMLDAHLRMSGENSVTSDDIKIFNKYCTANSSFAQELVSRWATGYEDFCIRLLGMHIAATTLIDGTMPDEEQDILSPESAKAQFSFAIVSLLALETLSTGSSDYEQLTNSLASIFEESLADQKAIRSMAILDGIVRGEQRMRLDFRGRKFVDCLFHSLDFWNCKFDENTSFTRCRFMRCGSTFIRSNGAHQVVWEDCQFDAEFQDTLERGQDKIENSHVKKLQSIKSMLSDFYRAGGFRSISKQNLQKYYGQSNSIVPFNKLYKAMRSCELLDTYDKGTYLELRVSKLAMEQCERFITQGDPEKLIQDVCDEL